MVTSPLAPPNISAKAAATGTEMPNTASSTKAHSSDAEREAHHPQRMHVAAEGEFDQPRADLRRPEQRADQHHGPGVDAGAPEDRQQMRRQAGRHEGIGREGRRHQDERQAVRRQHLGRRAASSLGFGTSASTRLRGSAKACSGAETQASSAA